MHVGLPCVCQDGVRRASMCATSPVTHSFFSFPHSSQNHGQCAAGYLSVTPGVVPWKEFSQCGCLRGSVVRMDCCGPLSQQRVDRCFSGTENAQVAVETFWVPSVIKSDQASLFVGSWFENLCAGMGIWQAFSQAYHHQANGRANVLVNP